MNLTPQFPDFRQDLQILPMAPPRPGEEALFLLTQPGTEATHVLTERELFLCRQCDGHTAPENILERFEQQFNQRMSLPSLQSFLRQMEDSGFLAHAPMPRTSGAAWDRMRPLPLNANTGFAWLGERLAWGFSWPAAVLAAAALLIALSLLREQWNIIAYEIVRLPQTLRTMAYQGNFSLQTPLRILLIMVAIPFLREMAKGVVAKHHRVPIPEIRFLWLFHVFPRIALDLSAVNALPERSRRLAILAAGPACELALLALGLIGQALQTSPGPMHSFFGSLALAAAISLVLNLIPLGRFDGSLLLAELLDQPGLRDRAVRVARARLLGNPAPEPLLPQDRRIFFWYGLTADLYEIGLDIAVLGVLGYVLVTWLEGTGAVLFLAILTLRFEEDIRRHGVSVLSSIRNQLHPVELAKRLRSPWTWVAFVLVAASLTPFHYERSGEFRIHPRDRAEIRADLAAQIEAVQVNEGDTVTNGQLLVSLRTLDIERELSLARPALNRETSKLRNLQTGSKTEAVAKAEQNVRLAETVLSYSTRDYERSKELFDKQRISIEEHEAKLARKDVDAAALELARKDLDMVRSGAKPEEVDSQKAEVERLSAQVRHLEEDLARCRITAPIKGRVTTLYLTGKTGQMANPGDIIAVIEDTDVAMLRIGIPEVFAGEIRPGARVRAKVWAYPGRVFEGTVSQVLPLMVDRSQEQLTQSTVEQERGVVRNLDTPSDQILPVLAEFPNTNGLLVSQMTGYAKIEAGRQCALRLLLGPVVRFCRVHVWSWLP